MHDYAIDRHPKQTVVFWLAFIAIVAAPLVNPLVVSIAGSVGVKSGWITSIGTIVPVTVLFGGLYWAFDRHCWKWRLFRSLLLVPDLNGGWECTGKTVQKLGEKTDWEWYGTVTVTQSWSKILIHLKTQQSSSRSRSASICHDEGVAYRLLYQYRNEPKAGEDGLMIHTGAVEMLFSEDCNAGEGHYFTDQHRNTVGTMKLRRVDGDKT